MPECRRDGRHRRGRGVVRQNAQKDFFDSDTDSAPEKESFSVSKEVFDACAVAIGQEETACERRGGVTVADSERFPEKETRINAERGIIFAQSEYFSPEEKSVAHSQPARNSASVTNSNGKSEPFSPSQTKTVTDSGRIRIFDTNARRIANRNADSAKETSRPERDPVAESD